MPYAKSPHNIISANIMTEISLSFRKLEEKYIVFSSDQKIYSPSLGGSVYADTLAVCKEPQYCDEWLTPDKSDDCC
jgi:hypothetical protein